MNNLLDLIKTHGNEKKKLWWENYVKHGSEFLGVPMADLRKVLNQWCEKNQFDHLTFSEQEALVMDLFSGTYSEEKLLGTLLLSEHMTEVSDDAVLDCIEGLFNKRYIFDWNICDWLCVKVLTPRLELRDLSERLSIWSKSNDLWHRRAALVPFAQIKDHGPYVSRIFDISHELIISDERFSKTAVGWVLREMMNDHRDEVLIFCKNHRMSMTTEVINNILKHQEDKQMIKSMLKRS